MDRHHDDLTGQRFGKLTAIRFCLSKTGRASWECDCDCGRKKVVMAYNLTRRLTMSCRCLISEVTARRSTKHGCAKMPEYKIWASMRGRCKNKNDRSYPYYGGRGISVCKKWDDSFEAFIKDIGPRPSRYHSIDRIDNNGNYEPGNVKWSTMSCQLRNMRRNHIINAFGKSMCLTDWVIETGISAATITSRINRLNWTPEESLSTPPRKVTRRLSP